MNNITAALQSFLADAHTKTLINKASALNFDGIHNLDEPCESYYLSIPLCESDSSAKSPYLQVSIEINDDNLNEVNVWALADFYETGIAVQDGPDIQSDIVFFANQNDVDSEESLINQIVLQLQHTSCVSSNSENRPNAKFKMQNISTFVTFAVTLMQHVKQFNQARAQRVA